MLTINYCYTGMCFLERYGRSRGEKKGGQGWSSSSAWPLYYEGQQTASSRPNKRGVQAEWIQGQLFYIEREFSV